jgi:hypothetical protein
VGLRKKYEKDRVTRFFMNVLMSVGVSLSVNLELLQLLSSRILKIKKQNIDNRIIRGPDEDEL